jgi:hypothetical protein
MKITRGIVAFGILLLHGVAAAEMRVWTNNSGQLIEAEMVGVNAVKSAVKIRLKNGLEFEIAIDNLSPPDKAYAKDHWVAMQETQVNDAPTPGVIPVAALNSLPESFRARFNSSTRLEAIRRGGGTPEMEAAVLASLNRFKASQNPDGSWGRNNLGAMTGFVLQCFLGHGETADSSEFGATVLKGLMYLIELGRKNPHGLFTEKWTVKRADRGLTSMPLPPRQWVRPISRHGLAPKVFLACVWLLKRPSRQSSASRPAAALGRMAARPSFTNRKAAQTFPWPVGISRRSMPPTQPA